MSNIVKHLGTSTYTFNQAFEEVMGVLTSRFITLVIV